MEELTYNVTNLGDHGSQIITLVDAASAQNNVQMLESHQLESTEQQHLQNEPQDMDHLEATRRGAISSNSPHCLVCNAKLGVSARGALELFSDRAKTTHRQMEVHVVLSSIVNQEIEMKYIHSTILCKKCFKLIDDIDSLEGQMVNMKQVVTNKYMRTLAIIKQDSLDENVDNFLDDDPLHLEASAGLAKDDRDFKVYMSSGAGVRGRRGRRGRGRGRRNLIKLEIKQEESAEKLNESLLASTDDKTGLGLRIEEGLDNTDGTEMLMCADGILEDSAVAEAVEDVMEVDGLDLEDNEGCDQIAGITLATLSTHELNVNQENSSSFQDENQLPEENAAEYKCRFCSLKMNVFADIQKHMRMAHTDRLFECEVCQERLPTKAELLTHLDQHVASGEKNYACTMCPHRYALPRQLKDHIRLHMSKTFSCNQCPKRFRSENALQEHINIHTGNRPHVCYKCDKKFTSRNILKTHLKTHGVRQRPHQCKSCGKSFLTLHHLSDHLNLHQAKRNYVCEACGKAFATQRSLDLHSIIHSGVKNFSCSICNKMFARKGEVEDHERTHTGEKPFQCEICGSTFSQRSNLQSHKRTTHYQEKRYQCTRCPKAFKRNRLLVYHVMSVHTGERPYKCEQCNAGFVYPEHYKKHLRIHTGEKPFHCDICGKSFNSRDNRNAHKFIHSDKKPYECRVCGAGFMRKPMVASHLQGHGPTYNIEAYIKVNPPTIVANENSGDVSSPVDSVRTMKMDDDVEQHSLNQNLDPSVQLVRNSGREETVEVMSSPVHLIDAEGFQRYVIHTTNGDRNDETVGHFLTSLQGQVIEVRTEDIDRYSDFTADQMTHVTQVVPSQPTSTAIQQVSVPGDIRPFIQLPIESTTREIELQTQPGPSRDVTTSIALPTTRDATLSSSSNHVPGTSSSPMIGNRLVQYDTGLNQSTLRKVLTNKEDLRTTTVLSITSTAEARNSTAFRPWPQQGGVDNSPGFIGGD